MIYNGPMRFAHRGVAQKAPENTEGAFQAAVDAGYEGIELDIRLSKDGEAVICHDSHFARHTCGHPTKYCIRHLADMTSLEAMEFMKSRLEKTRDNEEFLISMNGDKLS